MDRWRNLDFYFDFFFRITVGIIDNHFINTNSIPLDNEIDYYDFTGST